MGQELCRTLVAVFGEDAVVASDIDPNKGMYFPNCHFEPLNVFATDRMASTIRRYNVTQIYHLAAILSADGEVDPHATWQVNLDGFGPHPLLYSEKIPLWKGRRNMGIGMRVRSMASPSPPGSSGATTIGRNTGWMCAACAIRGLSVTVPYPVVVPRTMPSTSTTMP